jgi:hypothetical protein
VRKTNSGAQKCAVELRLDGDDVHRVAHLLVEVEGLADVIERHHDHHQATHQVDDLDSRAGGLHRQGRSGPDMGPR